MQYNQMLRSQALKSVIKIQNNYQLMFFSIFSYRNKKHAVYSISYIFLRHSANESTTLAWNNQNIKVYPQERVFKLFHVILIDTTLLKILKLSCGTSVSLDLPVIWSD